MCYDVRFPELFRCLFDNNVDIIMLLLHYSTNRKSALEILVRSRAIETFSYVIGAAQGGMHSSGRTTYGHSMIVEPWGSMVAKLDNADQGIIYAVIDLDKVRAARKAIPLNNQRRIQFDFHSY